MTVPVLVLDIDNSTKDYNGELARRIWRTERRRVPKAVPAYSFVDCGWFDDLEHFLQTHAAAVNDGMFTTMRPYPHASRVLRGLRRDGWYIKIATHRLMAGVDDDIVRTTTVQGLAAAGIPYDELHFVADKHTVDGDVWVDDKPAVLEALDARSLTRVAYAHEYNAAQGGLRASSWLGLDRIVRGLDLTAAKAPMSDLLSPTATAG